MFTHFKCFTLCQPGPFIAYCTLCVLLISPFSLKTCGEMHCVSQGLLLLNVRYAFCSFTFLSYNLWCDALCQPGPIIAYCTVCVLLISPFSLRTCGEMHCLSRGLLLLTVRYAFCSFHLSTLEFVVRCIWKWL